MPQSERDLLKYFVSAIKAFPNDPNQMGIELLRIAGRETTQEIIKKMRSPTSDLTTSLMRTGDSMHRAARKRMYVLETDDIRTMSFQIERAINRHLHIDID